MLGQISWDAWPKYYAMLLLLFAARIPGKFGIYGMMFRSEIAQQLRRKRRGHISFPSWGSLDEGGLRERLRLAIGGSRFFRFGAPTAIAPISLPRIAFVFEVFERSILSWGGANRKSAAALGACQAWAFGIPGIKRRPGRRMCGATRWEAWATIAGIYGDRASIGRALLRTFPGSIDQ